MDFFQHQESARKRTGFLVAYFVFAVAMIIVTVYLTVATVLIAVHSQSRRPESQSSGHGFRVTGYWNPTLIAAVAGATVSVIGLGSLYKISSLSGGGEQIARELGGRPVNPNTTDLDERVVLNVVEEMALASGTPVPPVFLLDEEQGINAFAAGYSPNDAVIGVTRGAIETLTRDELQGVIAHEFSHILNGDMRLNIRLMGVLHGILLLALIGWGVLRSLRHMRFSSRGDKKGGAAGILLVMVATGIAFLIIGYIGVLFGKLIKSAVSRQREFLADASAVQFTRNPGGIGGALKKLGGHTDGSRIKDEMAEEASHMFFGNALTASFLNLLSTHPPLEDRIKRIDPSFDGSFPTVNRVEHTARDLLRKAAAPRRATALTSNLAGTASANPQVSASIAFQPESAVESIGTLDQEHVDYAAKLVGGIPERLLQAVHEPLGASAAVCCLLLDHDRNARVSQLQLLTENSSPILNHEITRLIPLTDAICVEARLPLVEMAIPALCQLSESQYRALSATIRLLVEADLKVSLFEFALQRILLRQLLPHFEKVKPRSVKHTSLQPLLPYFSSVLSMIVHTGHREPAAAQRAFAQGAKTLGGGNNLLTLFPREKASLKLLSQALDQLAEAAPAIKKRLLQACAACIDSDGHVTIEEGELLRVIAITLDCPMPPLLGKSSVAAG